MTDPEQFVLLHEIMELRRTMVDDVWLDPTTAVIISVAFIVAAHLLTWVAFRRGSWMRDYMMPFASVASIGISVVFVIYAVIDQQTIGEYEMLCETYRTLYGPLPWEVA